MDFSSRRSFVDCLGWVWMPVVGFLAWVWGLLVNFSFGPRGRSWIFLGPAWCVLFGLGLETGFRIDGLGFGVGSWIFTGGRGPVAESFGLFDLSLQAGCKFLSGRRLVRAHLVWAWRPFADSGCPASESFRVLLTWVRCGLFRFGPQSGGGFVFGPEAFC